MPIRIDPSDLRGGELPFAPRDNRGYGWFIILLGLGGVIAGGVLIHAHWRTLKGYVHERPRITIATLSKIESPDGLPTPYVSLPPCQVIDTGVRRYLGRRRFQVNYVLVPVGDRFLLTEIPWNQPSKPSGISLSGHLDKWEPNRNGGGIMAEVKARGYGDRLLPYQLDAVGDGRRLPLDVALGPILIVAGLVFAKVGSLYLRP